MSLFAFFAVGRVADPFPFLWPLRLAMVTGALAGVAWVLAPGSFEEKVPLKIPQVRYVMILAAIAVCTVPLSVWPGASFSAVVNNLWKLILFFLLICYWVRSVQDIRRLTWMISIGISVLIFISAISPLDPSAYGGRFAASSTLYDPNDLALLLAMLMPLLVFLLISSGLVGKIAVSGMGLLCLYGIILTQSRGGFLALVAVVTLLLFRTKLTPSMRFVVIAFVLIVFATMAGTIFWDRMSTIWVPQSEYDRTAGDRTGVWMTALTLVVTRPWGTGYGVADIAEGLASGGTHGGRWSTAHNSFLQIGVELGVAGLVVFLRLLRQALKDLRRLQVQKSWSRVGDLERHLASMLEVSLYGFIVGGFFLSQAYSMLLYFLLALSVVLNKIALPDETSPDSGNQSWKPGHFAGYPPIQPARFIS